VSSLGTSAAHEFTVMELQDVPKWMSRLARLRYGVWTLEGELEPEFRSESLWMDEHDTHARHWVILHGGMLVAASRFCVHDSVHDLPEAELYSEARISKHIPSPVASINRFVVAHEYQGHGLAAMLEDAVLGAIDISGVKSILIVATPHMAEAAQHRGFRIIGEPVQAPFVHTTLDCRVLFKPIGQV
jgi:GNAT superfamily N-acetyltransferase